MLTYKHQPPDSQVTANAMFSRYALLGRGRAMQLTVAMLFALILIPGRARADLFLPGCATVYILEGHFGAMDCPVTNFGPNPVAVTGEFAFSVRAGGDPDDVIIGIIGLGLSPDSSNPTTIAANDTKDFQFLLFTGYLDYGPDSGLNIVSPIFSGTDTVTGEFAKGSYAGGLAFVLDSPVLPPPVTAPVPRYAISSLESSDTLKHFEESGAGEATSRYVTNSPEPSPMLLLGFGLACIVVARCARPAWSAHDLPGFNAQAGS